MKKTVLTAVLTMGLALGALAQGTFNLVNDAVGGYLNIQTTLNGPIDVYSGPVTFEIYSANFGALKGLDNSSYANLSSLGYSFEQTLAANAEGGLFNAGRADLTHITAHASSADVVVVAIVPGYRGLAEFQVTDLGDNNPLVGGATFPGSIANMPDLTMTLAVPEPSTIALGVMGLSALLFRRRK